MKRDLNCFDPNLIELCIFCGLYFDFFLSSVFKYKALVGDLSSFIRALYQGWIFLAATEQKRYRLVVLWARTTKFFFFFYVFFHGVCKHCNDSYVLELHWWRARPETSGDWTHKYHQTALLFITRFLYWTFLYLLYLLSLIGIFFRYLFVLIYLDGSRRHTHATTHSTRTQIVRAKMTSLDGFFAGKQVELTFVGENIKNLPLALHAREIIWARLVGKSRAQLAGKSTLTWLYSFVLRAPQWWRA